MKTIIDCKFEVVGKKPLAKGLNRVSFVFKKSYLQSVALVMVLAFSAGCGGGSSSTSTTQTPTQDTTNESRVVGTVVDSQIIGLRYISTNKNKTQTKEGITNSKGEYEYFEDGTTKFYVGKIAIAQTTPNKMVSITAIANTEIESQNIARFLQTIDEDLNPENGIQISSSVDEHAKRDDVSNLKFDDSFDDNFDSVKTELFKHVANIPETISIEQALNHSSKSQRLSSLHEFDLYKYIANEKYFRSTSGYYNADIFENDQRKRVYLFIWEKLLAKELTIENELATQEFNINDVEEEHDRFKKYVEYAETVASISTLGKSTFDIFSKAGNRSVSYNIVKLSALNVNGCDATVKLYDANIKDTIELSDSNVCKNMMKILNPVDDSTSKLAVVNPILSSFIPEMLPHAMKLYKMNFLKTNAIKTISKYNIGKPDYVSLGLSIIKIVNDSHGAYRASNVNNELITRLVAQEWLSIWFRSGFNQDYMNKLINNNSEKLIDRKAQIEAIALKFGSSGALCDAYKFFNPFHSCEGIENMNYDYDRTIAIIDEKLSKSNALYRNIAELTGSFSNEKAEIGIIEFDWIRDANLSDYNTSKSVDLNNTFFHDSFDGSTLDSSKWTATKTNNASFALSNGSLIATAQGGSDGYMGKTDGYLFTSNLSNLPSEYEIVLSGKEIERVKNGSYKDNSGFGLHLSDSSGSTIAIGIGGNYSGYHPDPAYSGWSYYDQYQGHRIAIYAGKNNSTVDFKKYELDLNTLYNVDFKIAFKNSKYTLSYRLSSTSDWINDPLQNYPFDSNPNLKPSSKWIDYTLENYSFDSNANLKPSFEAWSGDGGVTRKNGKFVGEIIDFYVKSN